MPDSIHQPDSTRRGQVSRRIESLSPSGIRRFFDLLATMDDVISLGVGQPDFVTPAVIRNAAIRSIEEGQTHYTSNYGILELREAISRHLEHHYGVFYEPANEIIVTTGVSEGLNIALGALIDFGDEVLCPDPHFVAYPPAVVLADGVFVPVPTSDANSFKLRAEDLEERITPRTKALLIGYPANPTGAVMERDDLLAVAEVARKHNLFVISDEIYDRLVYGHEHTCFASLPDMRDRTILLGGFSKAYAMTGWRLGYVAARADLIEAMMKAHQYVMMSAPTVAQYAGLEALLQRRGGCPGDGRRVRPAPSPHRRRLQRHRPEVLRAAGRLLRLPLHQLHRPHRRGLRRDAADGGESGRRARLGLRRLRHRARARLLRPVLRAHRRGAGADAPLRRAPPPRLPLARASGSPRVETPS